MRQFSAALLSRALRPLTALLAPPRGRHASPAGLRRRRSTRVRRYAPVPAPVEATTPPPQVEPAAGRPTPLLPAPRPVVQRAWLPSDDPALVRPYFEAHERELDRIQAEATARIHRWSARAIPPPGDLLAADPRVVDPRAAEPRVTDPRAASPVPITVPAPRAPSPSCDDPDDWRAFTRLTRVWLDQQTRKDVAA